MAYATIADASAHFQATLYTGSSSSVTVTNGGNSNLQPDLIWIKRRNGANDHNIFDTNTVSYTHLTLPTNREV